MAAIFAKIDEVATKKYPKPDGVTYSYGTAGFRTSGDVLDSVMFRMGLLAALRSKSQGGKAIGVVVTASHNPEKDNGVKLVDPLGEMLAMDWEKYATQLSNAPNGELASMLTNISEHERIDLSLPASVVYGRDTRETGPRLVKALQDGFVSLEAAQTDLGVTTTPLVHYVVRCVNTNGAYGLPTKEGYYEKLAAAFGKLKKTVPEEPPLNIDCANGVGAIAVKDLAQRVRQLFPVVVVNNGSTGALNDQCGADFVKVQQKAPRGCQPLPGQRWASFDGDADRIVYFYLENDGTFKLLDGDKIATLAGGFLGELLTKIGVPARLGVVQTAYANGSSTKYLTETMHVETACVPTGVKHVHHKAQDYDIGVYFEANGHGTVLFSPDTEQRFRSMDRTGLDPSQCSALDTLLALIDVINQTVGDALSDCLLVEAILSQKGWSLSQWNSCYTDLPSKQLKVNVVDRNVITTTNAERTAVTPPGLQDRIDEAVAKVPAGRSFVRPSGTEDVVRVYAEAETQPLADKLAWDVAQIVYDMAGGAGPRPTAP